MAKKVTDIKDLVTDVKLWKKDWHPTVATGYIVLGGCIQVEVRLIEHNGTHFVSWPRRKGEVEGETKYFDMVKPIDDEGQIDKDLGNKISAMVKEKFDSLSDDPPF